LNGLLAVLLLLVIVPSSQDVSSPYTCPLLESTEVQMKQHRNRSLIKYVIHKAEEKRMTDLLIFTFAIGSDDPV
jgi:hypothetical protein